jgi:hypothetical protein
MPLTTLIDAENFYVWVKLSSNLVGPWLPHPAPLAPIGKVSGLGICLEVLLMDKSSSKAICRHLFAIAFL